MSTSVPPYVIPAPPPSSAPANPVERSAVTKVMLFGALQAVSLVISWAASFYIFGTAFAGPANLNLHPNPTPAEVSAALGPVFKAFAVIVPLAILIQAAAILVLALALRQFSKVDGPRFSVPSTLLIVMIAGLLIVALGAIPLFNNIPNIIAQAPTGAGSTPSAAFTTMVASLLIDVALLGLGSLLLLIGLIGGQILGLWRVGSRYDETVIKLGAIFAVIPLLNVVAPILVIVGAFQIRGRLPRT